MNLIEALHLHPNIACITMDADHLDIYGTSNIEDNEFANKIADKTKLFITNDLPLEVAVSIDDAVYKAFNIRISDGSYLFDIDTPQGIINDFSFAGST
jgi:UDP-N-acetylmuramate--alanine ligase